jgi:hypothetical protein
VITREDIARIFGRPFRVVVSESIPAKDLAGINEEASRWSRDKSGVWFRVKPDNTLRTCRHCLEEANAPEWRRGGRMVWRVENGKRVWACHFCGRAAD